MGFLTGFLEASASWPVTRLERLTSLTSEAVGRDFRPGGSWWIQRIRDFLEICQRDIRVFPKIVGFPPKSSILMGFSIINYNPSILGVLPLFLETSIQPLKTNMTGWKIHWVDVFPIGAGDFPVSHVDFPGWWQLKYSFIFSLGEWMIQFDEHIFQMGGSPPIRLGLMKGKTYRWWKIWKINRYIHGCNEI